MGRRCQLSLTLVCLTLLTGSSSAAQANDDIEGDPQEWEHLRGRRIEANSTSPSSSVTGTPSASITGTPSSSVTGTGSSSLTATPSSSITGTPSSSVTGTGSSSLTVTPSSSITGTPSSSVTGTGSSSLTATPSGSVTGTPSSSLSPAAVSGTPTSTPSPSPSPSPSVTIDGHVLPTWFAVALAGSLIGFGMFQVFLGYKFFRFTLFFLGFLTVGTTIFVLAWDHINDPNSMWYGLAMGALGGLLVGLVGALIPRIGVFLVGAALGVVVALILNTTVLYRLYPANPNVTLGVSGAVLGLAIGGAATLMMRTVVVISTSFVGSYCTIRGIGYFAGNYPADEWALRDQIANGATLPVEIYAYFAGMMVLGVIGCVAQFMFTAKKRRGDEKDEWEEAYDDSDFSLMTGKGKKNKKRKGKKGKKGKSKSARTREKLAAKYASKKAGEALLDDYDYEGGGDDSYYDDGAGAGGGTGYAHDDYGDDYGGNDGGDDGGYELTPVSNAGGAGSGSRFGGWFGKKGAKEPAAIEW